MIISERIFRMLKEKELSQKDFSERTGIAQSTISDWKRKKTNPAADKILIICEVLHITPYELLSDTESGGKQQVDHIFVSKESTDYLLLEKYHSLEQAAQGRIWGYLQALAEKEDEVK